jgi:hypothetical protein
MTIPSLAQRSEGGPDLGREELPLLPSDEVVPPIDLLEVDEVGISLFGPTLRCLIELPGNTVTAAGTPAPLTPKKPRVFPQ